MAQAARQGLTKVGSRRELVEELERMNTPPKRQPSAARRAPRRGSGAERVKTYVLEAGRLVQEGRGNSVSWEIGGGGFDDLKILRVRQNDLPGHACEFYLDRQDARFLLLHTNEDGKRANRAIRGLVGEIDYAFDHTWFYTDMLQKWTRERGGADGKYGIEHDGMFQKKPTRVNIEGPGARSIYYKVLEMEELGGRTSQKHIDVQGEGRNGVGQHVEDRISNTGCFAIRRGKSVKDHLDVVGECKDEYRDVVLRVEDNMLGVKSDGGSHELKGSPFVIQFPKKIPNLEAFIDAVFNSSEPFRLWGVRQKISDGYYGVASVDLHEGSAINFEIADDMMRVYLREGSCGNTLVRLFTNLQLRYDTRVRCEELEL